jgi:hypothetical protein
MGLPQHSTITDELRRFDIEGGAPAERKATEVDRAIHDGDPLSAARGIALAVVLGGLVWAVILWIVL